MARQLKWNLPLFFRWDCRYNLLKKSSPYLSNKIFSKQTCTNVKLNQLYYDFCFSCLSYSPQSTTTTNVAPSTVAPSSSKLMKSALPSPSASYKQAMQKNHSKPNSMLPLPNALNQNSNSSNNSTSSNTPSTVAPSPSKIYQHRDRENQNQTGLSNPR